MVDLVLADHLSPEVPKDWQALFTLLAKLNRSAAEVTEADIARARQAGWTDEAVYDAVTTCALFNFFNTWVDGTGVPPLPDEVFRATGKRMAGSPYA